MMKSICTVYVRCDICDELVEERRLRASHLQEKRHRRLAVDLHGEPRTTFHAVDRYVSYHKAFDQEFHRPVCYYSDRLASNKMYVLSANVYRTPGEAVARFMEHLNTVPAYLHEEQKRAWRMARSIDSAKLEAVELRYYATMEPYSEDDGGFIGRWHFIERDLTLANLTRNRGAQPAWALHDSDIVWDREENTTHARAH